MLLLFFTVFVLVREISGSDGGNNLTVKLICSQVRCVFPMSITSEFRLEQYRDYDHRGKSPHFDSYACMKCNRIL